MMSENAKIQVRSYRDLSVWQKSVDLVVECYRLTKDFPRHETFGLVSQIRRAATAIPANIAEGHGRDHLGDYLHHLSMAKGSLAELETHLTVAHRLGYLASLALEARLKQTGEVGRMLEGLTRNLRKRAR